MITPNREPHVDSTPTSAVVNMSPRTMWMALRYSASLAASTAALSSAWKASETCSLRPTFAPQLHPDNLEPQHPQQPALKNIHTYENKLATNSRVPW
jgi:hypothetical protein